MYLFIRSHIYGKNYIACNRNMMHVVSDANTSDYIAFNTCIFRLHIFGSDYIACNRNRIQVVSIAFNRNIILC